MEENLWPPANFLMETIVQNCLGSTGIKIWQLRVIKNQLNNYVARAEADEAVRKNRGHRLVYWWDNREGRPGVDSRSDFSVHCWRPIS